MSFTLTPDGIRWGRLYCMCKGYGPWYQELYDDLAYDLEVQLP